MMNWKHLLIICASLSCTAMKCEKSPVLLGQQYLHCTIDGEMARATANLFVSGQHSVSILYNSRGDSLCLSTDLTSMDEAGFVREFYKEKRLKELVRKQWPPVADFAAFQEAYKKDFYSREFQPETCYIFRFKMKIPVAKMVAGSILSEKDCEIALYWYAFLPYDPRTELYIIYHTESAEIQFDKVTNRTVQCRFSCNGQVEDQTSKENKSAFCLEDGFFDLVYPGHSASLPEEWVKDSRDFILKYKQEHEGY